MKFVVRQLGVIGLWLASERLAKAAEKLNAEVVKDPTRAGQIHQKYKRTVGSLVAGFLIARKKATARMVID